MSGEGRPEVEVRECEGIRLAIAATRWHEKITSTLLERALAAAAKAGVKEPTVVRVPGAVELPVVARRSPSTMTRWSRSVSSSAAAPHTSSTCATP